MGTIAHNALGSLVGSGSVFQYVAPEPQAALPAIHPQAAEEGYNGSSRWHGKVSDHAIISTVSANALARHYEGGDVAVLPVAGDCILFAVLPSSTDVFDLMVSKSVAGNTHRLQTGKPSVEGVFQTGIDLNVSPPSVSTGPVGLCDEIVPVGEAAAAWPEMDLFIGNANGPLMDLNDPATFGHFLALADSSPPTAELALMGDTGTTSEAWLLWGRVGADVPANSYCSVRAAIQKAARF